MFGMEFSYEAYNTAEDLKRALDSGKVDVAFIDYTYENPNYLNTVSSFNEEFVALSKTHLGISNKYGLINNKLYMLKDGNLYNYISSNINANIKTISSYQKEISDDGILY